MRRTAGRLLYQVLQVVLVVVFLWSGISKALDPESFAGTIDAYGLLPPVLVFPAALLLIAAEIVVAVGLMLEKRGALTSMTLMMVLFLAVLGYGMVLGLDIDCGCFGPDDPEAQAFHDLRGAFVRDLFILLAIVYLYVWRSLNGLVPRPWFGRRRSTPNEEAQHDV